MYCGDDVSALVGDIGSVSCKFGYAGEDMPQAVFPSCIGAIEGHLTANENSSTKYCIGELDLSVPRSGMEVLKPIAEGVVQDWNVIEKLWEHALYYRMNVDPKEHPLLVAESSFSSLEQQAKYAELLFEKFDVPCLFLARDAVLSAFSYGRSTALVVSCGGDTTSVVPVHDGYVLRKASHRSLIGCTHLDTYLDKLFSNARITIQPRYQFSRKSKRDGSFTVVPRQFSNISESYEQYMRLDIVRDMKECLCKISEMTLNDVVAASEAPEQYELPDGRIVDVGAERFKVPEILFNPLLSSDDTVTGLHSMIYDSVQACDSDLRREMLNHILLTGGGSLFPGFEKRLYNELSQMIPSTFKTRIITSGSMEKKFSVFVGGSILASLGSFQQMWLSKKEYEEHGASICEQRFP